MADSDCIIVHEQVVVPDAVVVEEMVALPGEKGDKGDPFTYDDFTPEQIADLQRPATEAAAVANQAAEKANKAAGNAENAATEANNSATLANEAADKANQAAEKANKAATDIKALGDTLMAEEAKRESAESSRASAESERAEAEALRETSFSQMQTTLEGLISDTNTATSNANTAAGNAENAATEANNSATLANEAADKANQAAESIDNKISGKQDRLISGDNIEIKDNVISAQGINGKLFEDTSKTHQLYYFKNGLFFYCNKDNRLACWNEQTGEDTVYDEITLNIHSYLYNRNSCFVYKDGKIIVPNSGAITCWDLDTRTKIWTLSEQFYDCNFIEYKDFVYFYKNDGVLRLIDFKTGLTEKEFDLKELSGDSISEIQNFGQCEYNGFNYFLSYSNLFKIDSSNGDISFVGKIEGSGYNIIVYFKSAAYVISHQKICTIEMSNIENGTLAKKNEAGYTMNTYVNVSPSDSLMGNAIYGHAYKLTFNSLYYNIYVYADINMDEYVGRVIKGDFGYIQIPNPNLGNGKLLYPRYKKFN